jgi:hypothetical protein
MEHGLIAAGAATALFVLSGMPEGIADGKSPIWRSARVNGESGIKTSRAGGGCIRTPSPPRALGCTWRFNRHHSNQPPMKAAGKRVRAEVQPPKRKAGIPKHSLIANAPHGEKGAYVKVTVTLPPEVYELLANEATRRKVHKEANPQLSAVIREAVVAFLR